MNLTSRIFTLSLIALVAFACKKQESPTKPKSTSINKIMALGASRVEGNRPNYESFRYELWKDLVENEWTFDFVGTQTDDASYPDINSLNFDMDHEGRGGWTSGQILEDLEEWIEEIGVPDVVLFSSPGGNDALQNLSYTQALSNINEIINVLQNSNAQITIVIEQLAPAKSARMTVELTDYLNRLHQDVVSIANDKTTSTSRVIPVDMFTGFGDRFLADDVHYNEAGAEFIAARYYTILENLLEE